MATLRDSLKQHEGLRLKPYTCTTGALTVGYGRNLDSKGITLAEAEIMLNADIQDAVNEMHRAFPGWQKHSPERQSVLVEMLFNMGAPRLATFKKMWAALDVGDYDEAAKQMIFSNWAAQVGQRSKTLSDRMKAG